MIYVVSTAREVLGKRVRRYATFMEAYRSALLMARVLGVPAELSMLNKEDMT